MTAGSHYETKGGMNRVIRVLKSLFTFHFRQHGMTNDTLLTRLTSDDELQAAVDPSFAEPTVVFKHSLSCPVSAWARDEMLLYARGKEAPVYEVIVQTARPVSNAIAERFGVIHESPQVLVLDKGRVVHHASHRRVTAAALRDVLRRSDAAPLAAPMPA